MKFAVTMDIRVALLVLVLDLDFKVYSAPLRFGKNVNKEYPIIKSCFGCTTTNCTLGTIFIKCFMIIK